MLEQYKSIYTKIIIDEFQDTNYLNIKLIELLLHKNVRMELYGDPLQRIYGFIGTVENLFDIFGEKNNFSFYKLEYNYRFKDNMFLIELERRVRSYANDSVNAYKNFNDYSHHNIKVFDNHQLESDYVVQKVKKIKKHYPNQSIAILTPQRGPDINLIKKKLCDNKIHFFDALNINTESYEYKVFCNHCAESFQNYFNISIKILKKELNNWISTLIKGLMQPTRQQKSLIELLKAFLKNIVNDRYYRRLNNNEKYEYILSVFLEHDLHRYLSAVDISIQILTVHTSKGLEWDNVLLVDVEKNKLPNFYGMCESCYFKIDCNRESVRGENTEFLEHLSVFYVGVTRARINSYISLSKKDVRNTSLNNSCILNELKIVPLSEF